MQQIKTDQGRPTAPGLYLWNHDYGIDLVNVTKQDSIVGIQDGNTVTTGQAYEEDDDHLGGVGADDEGVLVMNVQGSKHFIPLYMVKGKFSSALRVTEDGLQVGRVNYSPNTADGETRRLEPVKVPYEAGRSIRRKVKR